MGAEGEPAVLADGGDGAEGEPELKCTLGAEGELSMTGSESDVEGEPDPLHVIN